MGNFLMKLRNDWEKNILEREEYKKNARKKIKQINSLILHSEVVNETEQTTTYSLIDKNKGNVPGVCY